MGRHSGAARSVWWCALGCALLATVPAVHAATPAPAPPEAVPPRVNLEVQWRWSEGTARRLGAPMAGSVVTSTTGSTAPAQGQVTVRSGAGVQAAAAFATAALPARVVLANGGAARLRLTEAVPLQAVQAWQEPGGTGAALVPGWAESVQALELRVRWPGGRAPAEVEIEVEQAQPPAADGSSPNARRERLGTRALVPLGEWVTVAAWGGADPRPADATSVSTTALEARTTRLLQLRLGAMAAP